MLVHNNGWQISRAGPRYILTPPGREDGAPGTPNESGEHRAHGESGARGEHGAHGESGGLIYMPSRSRALADALRTA